MIPYIQVKATSLEEKNFLIVKAPESVQKQIEKIIGELSQSNLNKPDYRICPIPGFFYY